MIDAPELKPCPFCGGDKMHMTEDARGCGFIGCDICFARGPTEDLFWDSRMAHKAWNTRVYLHDAIRKERDELRAIIKRMDSVCPVADSTCDEPGITLSEATRRELFGNQRDDQPTEGDRIAERGIVAGDV